MPQDYAQAVVWYRKAADQGNGFAQFRLGLMYARGAGVPEDYVLAYMWLNLAASRAEEDAFRKEAVTYRDLWSPK